MPTLRPTAPRTQVTNEMTLPDAPESPRDRCAYRRLTLVDQLLDGHLDALERFRSQGFPGRPLADVQERATSIPAFLNTMFDPDHPALGDRPNWVSGENKTGATCGIVRSVLRHPGVPYVNLRPLQLLATLQLALDNRRLGPRVGVVTTDENAPWDPSLFALGQVGATVGALAEALREAVTPERRTRLERRTTTEAPIRSRLIVDGLGQVHAVSRRLASAELVATTSKDLEYSLRRLLAFDGDTRSDPAHDLAGVAADLGVVTNSDEHLDQLVRRLSDPDGQSAHDAVVGLAEWVAALCDEVGYTPGADHEDDGEFLGSYVLATHLVRACRSALKARLADIIVTEDHIRTGRELLGYLDTSRNTDVQSLAHPAVAYWVLEPFVRGPDLADVPLDNEYRVQSEALLEAHRLTYYRLVARARMNPGVTDPYRLGYHLALEAQFADPDEFDEEIARATLSILTDSLTSSGTWPKRDRMWHSHKGDAYPTPPEMLTSLLVALQTRQDLLDELEPTLGRAIDWLDATAIDLDSGGRVWRAGTGSIEGPARADATSEAYSMLYLAAKYYEDKTAAAAVDVYGGRPGRNPTGREDPETATLMRMEADCWTADPWNTTGPRIADILVHNISDPLQINHSYYRSYSLASQATKQTAIRSGLLYGPPGTGKTTFVERFADLLGWPLISLNPVDFLRYGVEGVPRAAAEIFELLGSLKDCVVFVDEMEEFIRSRTSNLADTADAKGPSPGGPAWFKKPAVQRLEGLWRTEADEGSSAPDWVQRLWTTVFLPMLQDLHDRADVVFLVATNYAERVDRAIARPGRFDFRAYLMPPSPASKLRLVTEVARQSAAGDLNDRRLQELADALHALVTPGATDGGSAEIVSPGGARIPDVPNWLRFAYFSWADANRLGERLGRLPASIPPTEFPTHVRSALEGIKPVGFTLEPVASQTALDGLDLPTTLDRQDASA